jgi:hypothetical protein
MEHDNKLNSNSKSNAMPQSRPAQQEPSAPTIALALGFDNHNQTRSAIRFEWNGRLGVEFDHGQGVARPSLYQMKDMKV